MTDTKELLVAFSVPRLTDKSAAAIKQELEAASHEGAYKYIDVLDAVAGEVVELLPDHLEQSDKVGELSWTVNAIAEQIHDTAMATALGHHISQAYIKRQEGVEAE